MAGIFIGVNHVSGSRPLLPHILRRFIPTDQPLPMNLLGPQREGNDNDTN